MSRKIIHIDLDAFFCSVEELRNPALVDIPFAIGGRPEERGVVASCSYAARKFGVQSAMPTARALRLCPELLILPSRHDEYGRVSQKVMDILNQLTPLVEQLSIDEAFLDVSDLPEPAGEIARRLQAEIRDQLKLPCSLGVASNKLVAKIATDVGKAASRTRSSPNAITVVPTGEEASFLQDLPVRALWGVGPKTAGRLAEMGVFTIGQLASQAEVELVRLFGKSGRDLAQRALGIDERPVITIHEIKSLSQETTFTRDIRDEKHLRQTLRNLSERIGERLRASGLSGTTVRLKLRWSNFSTITRQMTMGQPTDQDEMIYLTVAGLFDKAWQRDKAVRLIGVGVSGLRAPLRQLSFWDEGYRKNQKLLNSLDTLKERYGKNIVQRASTLDD